MRALVIGAWALGAIMSAGWAVSWAKSGNTPMVVFNVGWFLLQVAGLLRTFSVR